MKLAGAFGARQLIGEALGTRDSSVYTEDVLLWGSAMDIHDAVHSDPETLGGTPVFVATRVPVQSLFDYIEGGDTLDEFLRQFPSVTRERALAALDAARDLVLAGARTS